LSIHNSGIELNQPLSPVFTILLCSDSPESAKLWSSPSLMSSGEHLGSIQVRIHVS
jgi:hypothetical protein